MLKRAMIVQKVAKMCAFVNNVQTRGLLLCARCGRSFTNSHKMLCWILTVSAGRSVLSSPADTVYIRARSEGLQIFHNHNLRHYRHYTKLNRHLNM